MSAADLCICAECASLDRKHPHEGRQLRLLTTRSGGEPEAAPFTDPDAPATVTADVSAPQGRPVETRAAMRRGARGRKPENVHG